MTKEQLKEILLNDDWHIGDGVDDCAGTDELAMEESLNKIAILLKLEGDN